MNDDREITTVLDRLVDTFDDETGDWGAVLERAAGGRGTVAPRRRRLLLAAVIVPAVGVGALAATTPWRGGPTVIERAAAAISAPTSTQVLHERVTVHVTPSVPPPAIRRRAHGRYLRDWLAHVDVWLAGASPHDFRIAMTAHGRAARGTVIRPPASEIGGRLGAVQGFGYDRASHALDPVPFRVAVRQRDVDPAAFVEHALATGDARVEGRTTVNGRDAIRIRVTARIYGRIETIAQYYVDARTYGPIRVVIEHFRPLGDPILAIPFTSLTLIQLATLPPVVGRYVFDFDRYEHVPPSAANRAETSITAQHPHAPVI